MPSVEECLQRADEFAQEVMHVWVTQMNAGNASALTDEFKNLSDRADDYVKAKRVADNHRTFNALSEEEAAEELKTRRAFAETYQSFHEKHQR